MTDVSHAYVQYVVIYCEYQTLFSLLPPLTDDDGGSNLTVKYYPYLQLLPQLTGKKRT